MSARSLSLMTTNDLFNPREPVHKKNKSKCNITFSSVFPQQ